MKRLMIAGFGDVARRALPRLDDRFEVLRIARRYGSDLDRPESLALEGAHALLHCAVPPLAGDSDTRTANLLAALEKGRILPARVVYVSTSGVYGDCAGARVDESRPLAPQTPRAQRVSCGPSSGQQAWLSQKVHGSLLATASPRGSLVKRQVAQ